SRQLEIIDVSSSTNPFVVSSTTLPGVSGLGAVGNSIIYYNGKVYIGTKSATGPEFHVMDVSSTSSPSELGSFEVGADINAISLSVNTAYLATASDTAELLVLDVSNQSSIKKLGTFDASVSYDGESLSLDGTALYLVRQTGGGDEL